MVEWQDILLQKFNCLFAQQNNSFPKYLQIENFEKSKKTIYAITLVNVIIFTQVNWIV